MKGPWLEQGLPENKWHCAHRDNRTMEIISRVSIIIGSGNRELERRGNYYYRSFLNVRGEKEHSQIMKKKRYLALSSLFLLLFMVIITI